MSRACASKWVNRYLSHGELELEDRSSTPHHQPTATPSEVLALVEELRRIHKVVPLPGSPSSWPRPEHQSVEGP
ncbi:hypothetical protein HUT19_40545 [Streptomyces sp. NA02950]|nr:hypothetical protein HUT19_40545 [Streptomyces sp. NA02950]